MRSWTSAKDAAGRPRECKCGMGNVDWGISIHSSFGMRHSPIRHQSFGFFTSYVRLVGESVTARPRITKNRTMAQDKLPLGPEPPLLGVMTVTLCANSGAKLVSIVGIVAITENRTTLPILDSREAPANRWDRTARRAADR